MGTLSRIAHLPQPLRSAEGVPFLFLSMSCRALKNTMRNSAHIADLERQYKAIEAEIAEALIHNPIDDLIIVVLKRRLLDLRDRKSVV